MTLYIENEGNRGARKCVDLQQGSAIAEDQLQSSSLRIALLRLHWTTVEHVQHVGVGGASRVSVVADQIVDAHGGAAGLRSRGRSRAITTRGQRVEVAVGLRRRVIAGAARRGGRLGMGRGRSAGSFVGIGAGRRSPAWWLRSVVGLLTMLRRRTRIRGR